MGQAAGTAAFARHYIRDLVYGANDGIITTFAVVAGVAGGALSHTAILVVGAANLAADGLSMGVGNYLAIRAHESARQVEKLPVQEAYAWRHGLATLVAFVVAGALPLAPFFFPIAATSPLRLVGGCHAGRPLPGRRRARGSHRRSLVEGRERDARSWSSGGDCRLRCRALSLRRS